jgi:hypothetical protein
MAPGFPVLARAVSGGTSGVGSGGLGLSGPGAVSAVRGFQYAGLASRVSAGVGHRR